MCAQVQRAVSERRNTMCIYLFLYPQSQWLENDPVCLSWAVWSFDSIVRAYLVNLLNSFPKIYFCMMSNLWKDIVFIFSYQCLKKRDNGLQLKTVIINEKQKQSLEVVIYMWIFLLHNNILNVLSLLLNKSCMETALTFQTLTKCQIVGTL